MFTSEVCAPLNKRTMAMYTEYLWYTVDYLGIIPVSEKNFFCTQDKTSTGTDPYIYITMVPCSE